MMTIEVRRCRVSVDWRFPPRDQPVQGGFATTWRVIKDGKMVDSFTNKGLAEKKAATLRRKEREGQ